MIEKAPKVSVVCAWYNRADFIRGTIASLLAQDYPNFDITIVNDGSPDARVREILDSYDDSRLRVIHQSNTGFTRAIRRAIAESDGEYIAIQGAGDLSLPQRLSAQVRAFLADTKLGIVGTHFAKYDIKSDKTKLFKPTNLKPGPISLFGFSHGELMYRRSVYDEVGGYDVNYTVGQGAPLWSAMLQHYKFHCVQRLYYFQIIFDDGVSKNRELLKSRRKKDKTRQIEEMKKRIEAATRNKPLIARLLRLDPESVPIITNSFYLLLFGTIRQPPLRKIWIRLSYSISIETPVYIRNHTQGANYGR